MAKRKKQLDNKTKIIIFLSLMVIILLMILGSKATIHGNIPVDAMQDPIPFRQSCEIPTKSGDQPPSSPAR